MKIETTPQEDHQIKIVAEFEADVFESYKKRAARKIAAKAKIPGFRPGKAPYEIILRHVGEGAISEEAIEILVDEQYPKILEEAAINPAGAGSLQEVISMDPPKFSFLIPLQPEVDLGDYKSIRVDYVPQAVEQEEIDAFLKRLQQNYATAEPIERTIENGDLVYYKISASDPDNTESDSLLFQDRPIQIIVGENLNNKEWPFEGFSNQLLGLSEGEKKDITHTFTSAEESEEFKEKSITFSIEIQSVKSLVLPELDDEFAKMLGHFENYEDLLTSVKTQLENNKNEEYEDKYYTEVLEKIADQATIKYPPFMLDDEIKHVLSHVEEDLKQQKLDIDTYLRLMKTDKEKYIEENVKPAAEKRLINSLIIDKFAQLEKIEIGKDDMDRIMSETSMMLQSNVDLKGKKTKYSKEQVNSATYNAMTNLYNERTIERLKNLASGVIEKEEAEKAAAELVEKTSSETEPESQNTEVVQNEDQPKVEKKKRTTKKPIAEVEAVEEPKEEAPAKKTKRKTKNESEQS